MKLSMHTSIATICLAFTLTGFQHAKAQLYSNGNNTIPGNKIGIGVSTPQASLHIKDFSSNLAGSSNIPMLRLQSTNTNIQSLPVYKWDINMNQSQNLTFWQSTGNNPSILSMAMTPSYIKIYSKLKIGEYQHYGRGLTPDNSQGYHMSLGLRELSSGAWDGKGAALFTTSSGEFQLMTNHTSSAINGVSNMANNVRFSANHYGIEVHKDINQDKVDLTFIDPAISGSDQRLFTMRALGTNHSSAPNTLEFWDPQNNGNVYFTMPVRIGGSYADVNILASDYDLYVEGGIRATTVKVDAYSNWPDYVFENNYDLQSLEQMEQYITKHKHLPGVPSAKEVGEEGIELAEMNAILLRKIEELTLHLIDLKKEVNHLKQDQ